MTVTVGQIVTYTPSGPNKSTNPRSATTCPAIVTAVIDQNTVNLTVFRDLDSPIFIEKVKNTGSHNTWI